MSKDSVVEFRTPEAIEDPLTELLRQGAKRLIQQAIEAELEEMLVQYAQVRDERGVICELSARVACRSTPKP